jgi:pSer/pThr/pTyr-binding forkhead associated (FHA) protein
MERLIVNPGSPTSWEIELKPGANTIGRGFSNDVKITDPSVSTAHCQIIIDSGKVIIKDMGSTNGTFVNRAPITEASLETGQTVHLGEVELLFQSDAPPRVRLTRPPPAVRLATPSPPPAVRLSTPPPPVRSTEVPVAAPTVSGSQHCKFHPKTLGRFFCNQCQVSFCELCITSRPGTAGTLKLCRKCGSECLPVQVQIQKPGGSESFYRRLPGVFAYPLRGSGIFVLIVCTIVMAALDFVSRGLFAIFIKALFFGYLFAFMQNIIHATAAGDEEMPGWPSSDGLFGGFFRLLGAALMAFGPAFALFVFALFNEESSLGSTWMIPALVFGCLYFPMALLAVAMKDTPLAANPLVVMPAIFKVPLEYLLAVVVMAVVMGVRASGSPLIHAIFPRELMTSSMPKLAGFLGAKALWGFVNVYFLAVNVRILGLLYLTKKQKFGWFER